MLELKEEYYLQGCGERDGSEQDELFHHTNSNLEQLTTKMRTKHKQRFSHDLGLEENVYNFLSLGVTVLKKIQPIFYS